MGKAEAVDLGNGAGEVAAAQGFLQNPKRIFIAWRAHGDEPHRIEPGKPQARRIEVLGAAAPQDPFPRLAPLRQAQPMRGKAVNGAVRYIRRDQLMHRAKWEPTFGQGRIQLGQADRQGLCLRPPPLLQSPDAGAELVQLSGWGKKDNAGCVRHGCAWPKLVPGLFGSRYVLEWQVRGVNA